MTVQLIHGNCLDIIPTLPDCSVDSIVTDPPYELGFMGKKWDASGIAYNVELWQECLRVLKPGGHLLAFGGTRTYHRMACAIEDAGFEIRDSIHWLYGSGFPKSLDVSKAIDKQNGRQFEDRYALGRHIREKRTALGISTKTVNQWFGYRSGCQHWESQHKHGARVPTMSDWLILKERLDLSDEWTEFVARIEAEREVIGKSNSTVLAVAPGEGRERSPVQLDITAPATEQAKQWDGWGTALKPAHEPIVVARKPLEGTVAANVLKYGTGAINIDATRIGYQSEDDKTKALAGDAFKRKDTSDKGWSRPWMQDQERIDQMNREAKERAQAGRWPANVVFSHHEDCQQIGVRDDDYQINRLEEWSGFGQKKQPDYEASGRSVSVPVWECVPGCAVAELDQQSGVSKAKPERSGQRGGSPIHGSMTIGTPTEIGVWPADPGGGASRFFYCAKPSRRERNAGLKHLNAIFSPTMNDGIGGKPHNPETATPKQNHHPTVKPLALMRYLVRLVTPPNGTILEPFAGSGTTLMAAVLEGFNAIGIEMTDEYLLIIEGRVAWAEQEAAKQQEELFQ